MCNSTFPDISLNLSERRFSKMIDTSLVVISWKYVMTRNDRGTKTN